MIRVAFLRIKEVIGLTIIQCGKCECLNNKKGQCTANEIRLGNVCKSYSSVNAMMRPNTARVRKEHGRYKGYYGKTIK